MAATKLEVRVLMQVMSVLASTVEPKAIIKHLRQSIGQLFPGVTIDVLLYDKQTNELVVMTQEADNRSHQTPDLNRVRLGEGVCGRAASLRKVVYEADTVGLAWPEYIAVYPKTKSEVATPIISRGELLGVLTIESPQVNAFSKTDIQILSALGKGLAVGLRHARNIEELQKTLEQLRASQQRELAQEKWATVGSIVAALTHSINNYASLIRVYSRDLLSRRRGLDEEAREVLKVIARSSESLTEVSERLSIPFIENQYSNVNINEIITQALKVAVIPDSIEVRSELSPNLPIVKASSVLVEVFIELITNAVKAITRGRARGRMNGQILVETRWQAPFIVVEVTNSGPVIPQRQLETIFGLLKGKRHAGESKHLALGFGLWFARTYLRRIGGDICVSESSKTKGTTFKVSLPPADSISRADV